MKIHIILLEHPCAVGHVNLFVMQVLSVWNGANYSNMFGMEPSKLQEYYAMEKKKHMPLIWGDKNSI